LGQVGDTVTFLTAGGGGYGDPAQRDPAVVERDIALGYVSEERAKEDYPTGISDETRRQETGRHGDRETRRRGDDEQERRDRD
jgi:N-methylhydantoinase B